MKSIQNSTPSTNPKIRHVKNVTRHSLMFNIMRIMLLLSTQKHFHIFVICVAKDLLWLDLEGDIVNTGRIVWRNQNRYLRGFAESVANNSHLQLVLTDTRCFIQRQKTFNVLIVRKLMQTKTIWRITFGYFTRSVHSSLTRNGRDHAIYVTNASKPKLRWSCTRLRIMVTIILLAAMFVVKVSLEGNI